MSGVPDNSVALSDHDTGTHHVNEQSLQGVELVQPASDAPPRASASSAHGSGPAAPTGATSQLVARGFASIVAGRPFDPEEAVARGVGNSSEPADADEVEEVLSRHSPLVHMHDVSSRQRVHPLTHHSRIRSLNTMTSFPTNMDLPSIDVEVAEVASGDRPPSPTVERKPVTSSGAKDQSASARGVETMARDAHSQLDGKTAQVGARTAPQRQGSVTVLQRSAGDETDAMDEASRSGGGSVDTPVEYPLGAGLGPADEKADAEPLCSDSAHTTLPDSKALHIAVDSKDELKSHVEDAGSYWQSVVEQQRLAGVPGPLLHGLLTCLLHGTTGSTHLLLNCTTLPAATADGLVAAIVQIIPRLLHLSCASVTCSKATEPKQFFTVTAESQQQRAVLSSLGVDRSAGSVGAGSSSVTVPADSSTRLSQSPAASAADNAPTTVHYSDHKRTHTGRRAPRAREKRRLSHSRIRMEAGPLFANVVVVHNLHLTPHRTRAFLHQALHVREVTIYGKTHKMPSPHCVIATYRYLPRVGCRLPINPLDPHMLDNFCFEAVADKHDLSAITSFLERVKQNAPVANPLLDLAVLQEAFDNVHVSYLMKQYMRDICICLRQHASVSIGPSPRSAQLFFAVSRMHALFSNHTFVRPLDVNGAAMGALSHRLHLRRRCDNSPWQLIHTVVNSLLYPPK